MIKLLASQGVRVLPRLAMLLTIMATATGSCWAQGNGQTEHVAALARNSQTIIWSPKVRSQHFTLAISGSDGLHFSDEFAGGGKPALDSALLPDGEYTYELVAAPSRRTRSASEANRSPDDLSHALEMGKARNESQANVQSGYFSVVNGLFVQSDVSE